MLGRRPSVALLALFAGAWALHRALADTVIGTNVLKKRVSWGDRSTLCLRI